FAFLRHDAPRGSVRQYFKTLLIVHDVYEHDLAEHLFMHRGVGDRHQRLHPAVEIARHQVGRADIDDGIVGRQAVAVAEAVDAAVLKEAPDDRLDADV